MIRCFDPLKNDQNYPLSKNYHFSGDLIASYPAEFLVKGFPGIPLKKKGCADDDWPGH